MKLCMSILADCLSRYSPHLMIQDGLHDIEGIRFYADGLPECHPDYVYIGRASDVFEDIDYTESVLMASGHDMIIVDESLETVVNEVLIAFDTFSKWEASLWEAVASDSGLQGMLDVSTPLFKGMSGIASIDGRSLAYSMINAPDEEDIGWEYLLEKKAVPTFMTTTSMTTDQGETVTDFSTRPQLFRHDNGKQFICAYLETDSEYVATLYIQEKAKPFTRAQVKIAEVLCNALTQYLSARSVKGAQSLTSLFKEIIENSLSDENSLQKLYAQENLIMPLVVMRFHNETTENIMSQKQLLRILQEMKIPNHSFIYENSTICIVNENDLLTLLSETFTFISTEQYALGISLPFSSWEKFLSRYRQSQFVLDWNKGKTGIFYSRDFAFSYLLKQLDRVNYELDLTHPALEQLQNYDDERHTDLFNTLKVLLENERNIVATARKLFIHRNSLMNRIVRIKELTSIDLNDFTERSYLTLSFLLDERNNHV